jgi:spermidine/putrescine transport system ATP-binding protein
LQASSLRKQQEGEAGVAGQQPIDRARPGTTPAGEAADIEFVGVTKRFGEVVAVDNVDLAIARGAFYTLLGPSGCGKTTSLRMIAGFDQPSAGDVRIGGASVVGIPAYKRPVNMVFQQYALFPHFDVADNIGYGLRQRSPRPSKQEIAKRVGETLELVRLPGFERRRIWELSGGQQQRVALARALINRPTVLLLDEPLAALDRKLRREMQIELQTLQREVGITFILVTHDQEEALSMSDTICIMRDGRIVQTGSPKALYDEPINGYVADFVGKSNFFAGEIAECDGARGTVRLRSGRILAGRRPEGGQALSAGERGMITVRPELIQVIAANAIADDSIEVATPGRVKNRIFLGEHTEYLVGTEELGDILALVPKYVEAAEGGFARGDDVKVGWRRNAALALAEG